MGKHKEGGVSANWEANDVMLFCDLCLKEIELGNHPTTHFSKDGWINLQNNFLTRTGKSYDRTQMKNKWDQLKKEWKLLRELKGRATGLGWDPIQKTIAAPEEWWKERLEVVPSAKKFWFVGIAPELEEKMEMMFTNVVATGELGWAPNLENLERNQLTNMRSLRKMRHRMWSSYLIQVWSSYLIQVKLAKRGRIGERKQPRGRD